MNYLPLKLSLRHYCLSIIVLFNFDAPSCWYILVQAVNLRVQISRVTGGINECLKLAKFVILLRDLGLTVSISLSKPLKIVEMPMIIRHFLTRSPEHFFLNTAVCLLFLTWKWVKISRRKMVYGEFLSSVTTDISLKKQNLVNGFLKKEYLIQRTWFFRNQ